MTRRFTPACFISSAITVPALPGLICALTAYPAVASCSRARSNAAEWAVSARPTIIRWQSSPRSSGVSDSLSRAPTVIERHYFPHARPSGDDRESDRLRDQRQSDNQTGEHIATYIPEPVALEHLPAEKVHHVVRIPIAVAKAKNPERQRGVFRNAIQPREVRRVECLRPTRTALGPYPSGSRPFNGFLPVIWACETPAATASRTGEVPPTRASCRGGIPGNATARWNRPGEPKELPPNSNRPRHSALRCLP